MFYTPEIIEDIPDIKQLYASVDKQVEKLNTEVDRIDEDVFFSNMSESRVERWEKILKITPSTEDTLVERRFRVQTRVLDRLPYSYNVVLKDLQTLAPEATLEITHDDYGQIAIATIPLSSESMLNDIASLLEIKLPLNMIYEVRVMYNTWGEYITYKWEDLQSMTWREVKIKENTGGQE